MKNMMIVTLALASLSASAHMIKGNPILRGSIKTKVLVDGVKTTCKVKIEKPKNYGVKDAAGKFSLIEDSYGNPGYMVTTEVELSGSDYKREIKIDFTKKIEFNNFHKVGEKSEVRDLDYTAQDGSSMRIDDQGRLKSYAFDYNSKRITCTF